MMKEYRTLDNRCFMPKQSVFFLTFFQHALHCISLFSFFFLIFITDVLIASPQYKPPSYYRYDESIPTDEYYSYATEEPSETINPEFICIEVFNSVPLKKTSSYGRVVPLTYSRWDARLSHTKVLDNSSGFIFSGGWSGTRLKWEDNFTLPLSQNFFQYLFASCGTYSVDHHLWKWSANGTVFVDPNYPFHQNYAFCRFIFRGNFQYTPSLNIHFGLINETGLRRQKTRPILGFVMTPSPCITLSAVYPVNMSAVYTISSHTSLGMAYRKTSFRKRPDEKRGTRPRQIIEYESQGTEVFAKINMAGVCQLKGTMGYAFHQKIFTLLDEAKEAIPSPILPSFYYGASLNLNF